MLFLGATMLMIVVAGGVAFGALAACDPYGNCYCKAGVLCEGTSKTEYLRGTSSSDTVRGYAGDDAIYGLDGNDILKGGVGDDDVNGGGGSDVCNGGPGVDQGGRDTCERKISIEKPY